ncbi:MAG: hypothetical protein RLZZ522_783, partial [Verrucomicrobiota bacterium]
TGTGGFSIGGGSRWLALYGTNTFSGGVILNDGSKLRINSVGAMGVGTLSLGNAAAGILETLTNLSSGQVLNTIDLTSGRILTVSTASGGLNLAGMIQNTGGLTKIGNNTLTLSGVNTYTGTTTVAAGILACNSATALGQGPVVITSGKLTLSFTGTRQVASLSLGGVAQANGSYGSTASPAANKNDTYFTGTGTVTVGPISTATSTTLTSSLGATAPYGSAVTFTATVAVTGGPAIGTVTFKDGVTVLGTGTLSSGTATFATSTLAIGAHSITASYEGDVTFATSASSVFAHSVTAKLLTLAGVTAGNKLYDATTTATLTGGTLSGVVSGEIVTVTAGSGTFASANAGLRAVTATGYALGGAHAGNYSLPTQPLVPNATISASPLTVTASNQSKTFGQTVTFSSGSTQFTSSGLQNGEMIGSVTLACTGGDAAAAVATYPITPSIATGGTFVAGNYAIQYLDGTLKVNAAPGYETWASNVAQGLTAGVNDDPSDDPDHDGFSNLMEFTLGGAPMVSSQAILPKLLKSGGNRVFEYDRSDAAQPSTTQTVEYGNNLTGWTPVAILESSAGMVEITPGTPSDRVKVTIPNEGTQMFVRLKVSQ